MAKLCDKVRKVSKNERHVRADAEPECALEVRTGMDKVDKGTAELVPLNLAS